MEEHSNYPILGEPVHQKGKIYLINERAIVGRTYTVVCGECGSQLTVTPKQKKIYDEQCPHCQAIMVYKAKDAVKKAQPPKKQDADQDAESGNEVPPTVKGVSIHRDMNHRGMLEWGGFFFKHSAPLRVGINTIGREDDEQPSDISFKDESMSRRSITIDVQKDDNQSGYKYLLTVLHATNPVFKGSSQLLVGDSVYLNFGDVITLGTTAITFKECKK